VRTVRSGEQVRLDKRINEGPERADFGIKTKLMALMDGYVGDELCELFLFYN
jgi:hypothetical protein